MKLEFLFPGTFNFDFWIHFGDLTLFAWDVVGGGLSPGSWVI